MATQERIIKEQENELTVWKQIVKEQAKEEKTLGEFKTSVERAWTLSLKIIPLMISQVSKCFYSPAFEVSK